MAQNDFSKEERVAFEDILEGFNDALVMSQAVNKYDIGDVQAERANDEVWRPQPYIMDSRDGIDQTGNFNAKTQLSVPSSLSLHKSVPFTLDAYEMRDGLQESRLVRSARQKIASDVNSALLTTAANLGTVVVARTGAATGFDDVAELDSTFNELGVGMDDRYLALASRDYNAMASNLAERQTMNEIPTKAYRKASVGMVSSFETLKLDVSKSLLAATATGVTIAAVDQRHVPKATDETQAGKKNVDNRFQTVSIAVTGGTVKPGDCFTIAGVNSVHHITKDDTMQLKTFRVIEIVTGAGGTGTVKISPAIVDGQHGGATTAEKQYQNVTATPVNGAAINFINTADAKVNPFWHKDAIELLPGTLVMPKDIGMAVMHGKTDQGLDVIMTRQGSIDNLSAKFRLDTYFGTVCCSPQQAGIEIFNQV